MPSCIIFMFIFCCNLFICMKLERWDGVSEIVFIENDNEQKNMFYTIQNSTNNGIK